MANVTPVSTARPVGLTVYTFLWPISVACFVGALVTDIAYWRSADMMWSNFSAWLLTAGLVVGVIAAIAGLIELLSEPLLREQMLAWIYAALNLVVLALSVINAFVHTHDAWTSVVPNGLILSAIVVIILIVTVSLGFSVSRRYRVGVV